MWVALRDTRFGDAGEVVLPAQLGLVRFAVVGELSTEPDVDYDGVFLKVNRKPLSRWLMMNVPVDSGHVYSHFDICSGIAIAIACHLYAEAQPQHRRAFLAGRDALCSLCESIGAVPDGQVTADALQTLPAATDAYYGYLAALTPAATDG